jgi:hypothetical protein
VLPPPSAKELTLEDYPQERYVMLAETCMNDAEAATSEETRIRLLECAQALLLVARGQVFVHHTSGTSE